jgi:hypothetical protein
MSKILNKLEGMAGTDYSALVINNRPIASTFSKEEMLYLKLSQQAFMHIFKQADKTQANDLYDEAHLQLGQRRLLCFRLEENTLYISMLAQTNDVQKAQKVIRGALSVLRKIASASIHQPPKT